ncbi:MAG TPA: hypothetical protein VFG14_10520 [Chthoniobacteraceae bacterium]|nr:hypothetical protein [Chthoniobacteraceae bacterium]
MEAGRKFNERAIDSLKAHLGRRWNPLWVGAGFTRGSLELPRDPLTLLLELREYLRHRPEHEIASIRLTAEEADLLSAAILQAVYLESKARAARAVARRARDAAFIKLRARLVGLRAELLQLLTPDDSAWRKFGFARPSDRRSPKPISEVSVRAGVEAGEVIVEWPPAVGAENYRVMRQVEDIDPEPVEVGIFTDRLVIFRALPAAKSVIISVSSRNQAGEALAATARLIRADAGSSNPSGPG